MANDETQLVHPWEKAGLGKAPFKWLGVFEDRGPHRYPQADGTVLEVGAPGQPMGCCAYCGQGIAECHRIRSSDGKEFTVGCDCVRKVEHKGSPVYTQAVRAQKDRANAKARVRAQERAKANDAKLTTLLADPVLQARLKALPSKCAWKPEATAWDDLKFRAGGCGAAGKARLVKELESGKI